MARCAKASTLAYMRERILDNLSHKGSIEPRKYRLTEFCSRFFIAKPVENMKIDFSNQTGKKMTTKGHHKACIHVESIIYIQSTGELTTIYLQDEMKVTEIKLLKIYEEELCSMGFFRINRNTIINGKYITKIITRQDTHFVFLGNIQLPISRRRFKFIKKYLT